MQIASYPPCSRKIPRIVSACTCTCARNRLIGFVVIIHTSNTLVCMAYRACNNSRSSDNSEQISPLYLVGQYGRTRKLAQLQLATAYLLPPTMHIVHYIYMYIYIHRATHVQNEDGSVVLLSASNPRQRDAIAKRLLTPSKEGSLGGAAKKVHTCTCTCMLLQ